MGTYDTRGGTPRHDPAADHEPFIHPEEERALEILEAANVPAETNDEIVKIIAATADRAAELRQALEAVLVAFHRSSPTAGQWMEVSAAEALLRGL